MNLVLWGKNFNSPSKKLDACPHQWELEQQHSWIPNTSQGKQTWWCLKSLHITAELYEALVKKLQYLGSVISR